MNSANEKYGPSLDRPQGPGKPVDPATRLSELLAQSLEELTRPFDPPRPGAPAPVRAAHDDAAAPQHAESAQEPHHPQEAGAAEPELHVSADDSRLDSARARA